MMKKYNALEDGTKSVIEYRVKSVVLWATESSGEGEQGIRHWISSYRFENILASDVVPATAKLEEVQLTGLRVVTQEEVDQSRKEIESWVRSKKKQRDFRGFWTWEGVSLDMCQPFDHVDKPRHSMNPFGSLTAFARCYPMLISERSMCRVEVFFKAPLTVKDLMTHVLNHKLHYYKSREDNASGCLFWQLELMHDFQQLGWIDSASLGSIKSQVESYAKERGTSEVPWPPVEGLFRYPQALPAHRKSTQSDEVRSACLLHTYMS